QSFNRYAYAGNDPANLVDPTGLKPGDSCMTGTGQPGIEGNDGRCYPGPVDVVPVRAGPAPIDTTTYRFINNSIGFRGLIDLGKALPTKEQSELQQKAKDQAKLALGWGYCETWLAGQGINMTELGNAVDFQRPYDGPRSTITAVKAGYAKPS